MDRVAQFSKGVGLLNSGKMRYSVANPISGVLFMRSIVVTTPLRGARETVSYAKLGGGGFSLARFKAYTPHRPYEERLRSEHRMPAMLRIKRKRAALLTNPPRAPGFVLDPLADLPPLRHTSTHFETEQEAINCNKRSAGNADSVQYYEPLAKYAELPRFELGVCEVPLIKRHFLEYTGKDLLEWSVENEIRSDLPCSVTERIEKDERFVYVSNRRQGLIQQPTRVSRRSGVIAIKRGMMAHFDENGRVVPVTVLQIEGCQVVRSTITTVTSPRQRYAVYVAANNNDKTHKATKHDLVEFQAARMSNKQHRHRFTVSKDCLLPTGTPLRATHFVAGQYVDVVGTSKGKGFSGVMRRFGFAGGPASHGNTKNHRGTGAINNRIGRVWPGTKMPGHHGGQLRLERALRVLDIHPELNLIRVIGSVPGPNASAVRITDSNIHRIHHTHTRTIGKFPTDFSALSDFYPTTTHESK